VQTEGGEGIVEHQARRLGTVPFAPPGRLTDEDAELGAAVTMVDARRPMEPCPYWQYP
jgi:hypothetical protein